MPKQINNYSLNNCIFVLNYKSKNGIVNGSNLIHIQNLSLHRFKAQLNIKLAFIIKLNEESEAKLKHSIIL